MFFFHWECMPSAGHVCQGNELGRPSSWCRRISQPSTTTTAAAATTTTTTTTTIIRFKG